MAFNRLKHFVRVHTMGEEGMKSFALISGPDTCYGDSCVTLVRCRQDRVAKEMRRWGTFTGRDIEDIEDLERGEQFQADEQSLIIRLS